MNSARVRKLNGDNVAALRCQVQETARRDRARADAGRHRSTQMPGPTTSRALSPLGRMRIHPVAQRFVAPEHSERMRCSPSATLTTPSPEPSARARCLTGAMPPDRSSMRSRQRRNDPSSFRTSNGADDAAPLKHAEQDVVGIGRLAAAQKRLRAQCRADRIERAAEIGDVGVALRCHLFQISAKRLSSCYAGAQRPLASTMPSTSRISIEGTTLAPAAGRARY